MNLNDSEYDVMLREIALQPAFVRASIGGVVERARAAMAEHAGRPVSGAIVIGCGDSFCAGLAARSYAMEQTGLWVEPIEALAFSRYLVDRMPSDRAVVGVSNSGSVARTVEGIRFARERGAWTFGVTVSAQSDLARAAETLVRLETIPNIKQRPDGTKLVTPGTLTYTASLVGVCGWAIALGAHLGVRTEAQTAEAVRSFERLAEWIEAAYGSSATLAAELAATFSRERPTVIAGGGPNAATAYFAAAKWYEALQWPAHHAEIEEWAHEQYFFTGAQTDTMVILPPGGSHARGLEQLRAAHEMGSRTIVIAEAGDTAAQSAADVFFAMPAGVPEPLTPFVYKTPFEVLAAQIAAHNGIDFFGFRNPLRQQVNFRQIFDSAQTPTGST
jgi:glucosamine 6-phosphate synthetase-like amidotransferase/phosphosugar isomerase protein